MNHWAFILAAYGVTLAGTLLVTWQSFSFMRRAEARIEALRGKR